MDDASVKGVHWECGRGELGRPSQMNKDRWGVVGVGAAPHLGGFIPGNLQADTCWITWAGKAVMKPQFYTLNPGGADLVWASAAEGKVPLGAVQGGVTEVGEDLYVGRCKMEGRKVHGKVQPSRMGCLVPHAGGEVISSTYEVLCARTVVTNFAPLMKTEKKMGSPTTSVVTRLSSLSPPSPHSPLSPLSILPAGSPTKRRPLRGSGSDSWRRITGINNNNNSSNIMQVSGRMKTSVSRTSTTSRSRTASPCSPPPRSPSLRTNTPCTPPARTISPLARTPTSRTTSPNDLIFVTPKSSMISPRKSPTSPNVRPTPKSHKSSSPEMTPGGWVRRRGRQGVRRLRRC